MNNKIKRPRNCGECRFYFRDPANPGRGWCDNWGGVHLRDGYVCNPNLGERKEIVCRQKSTTLPR